MMICFGMQEELVFLPRKAQLGHYQKTMIDGQRSLTGSVTTAFIPGCTRNRTFKNGFQFYPGEKIFSQQGRIGHHFSCQSHS